ncbi:phosphotransferase family protein [Asanoa sp. WMMD1127]|uniref:choline/ethanolamine kinase family protein n=1 Tax=Asanoa sp. WMMD1127 TaxID=3016107 RepID=UPI0024165C89|nr:choline/ethanolamine kinase family protein [Asanoa sp. WMMD1127]MDG4823624.1 phosphotransferase family protein [Asanoa sp. WMMD1127]
MRMAERPEAGDVLRRVSLFADRPVRATPVAGGLSHHIWRVDTGGRSYLLRVLDPAVSAAGLGIPPEQEIENTRRAADSGAGARVIEVLPDVPALVLEFLPGRTLHADDVRADEAIPKLAAACRRLHAGPAFANDFDILAKRRELLDICRRHDLGIPAGYHDRQSIVDAIGVAIARQPAQVRPCHNDLLPENFIDLAGDVRIVDYQLSGNNDPAFELGDIAAEADFDPDRTAALATAYYGTETVPALIARVRLNQVLSNVTWTLWFSVHHGLLSARTSTFDYAGEAADKWARATRDLDAPELGRLIDAAAGRTATPL